MVANSGIEWTHHTFNPWIGCTKVSPACDNCYAELLATGRLGREWGPHAARRRTKTWGDPVKWNKALVGTGRRERVFCASLADVFDNHGSITSGWHGDLWHLIARTPNLDWLLLTKRPQNIVKMLPESYGAPAWGDGWPNVWLGTTVENQAEAERRIPHLLSVPSRVHFLSCEPLLGPVRLDDLILEDGKPGEWHVNALDAEGGDPADDPDFGCNTISWVIAGGESGAHARPSHPDWFRSLRDQCAIAGVPFFFKQWGEHSSVSEVEGPGRHHQFADGATVRRVGKSRAGRTLDGVVHDGYPAMAAV